MGAARPTRIAIIEDESVLGSVLAELLADEGYESVQHAQAAGAHDFVVEQKPDLVLLDLMFDREAQGWGILDAHIVDPRTRGIPIILMTADTRAVATRRDRLAELRIPVLMKPFELAQVLDVIARALRTTSGLRAVS
jgi:two-component system, NtrC family, nitrogen regulation response regulator NtrX